MSELRDLFVKSFVTGLGTASAALVMLGTVWRIRLLQRAPTETASAPHTATEQRKRRKICEEVADAVTDSMETCMEPVEETDRFKKVLDTLVI